jgi:hypothetical protein
VGTLLIVLMLGLVLLMLLAAGAVLLIKLGVIARYALTPDRPADRLGEYSLEDSREPGEEGR